MCSNTVTDQYYCIVSDLLTVSLVAQELTSVSEKWQYIGEELGVKQESLRHISTNHYGPGDCLREVLSRRFESCATTWKHIVDVLRTPRIGESLLADNLEAKYCSCELVYSSVNAMWSINTLSFLSSHSLLQEFGLISLGFFSLNGLIC